MVRANEEMIIKAIGAWWADVAQSGEQRRISGFCIGPSVLRKIIGLMWVVPSFVPGEMPEVQEPTRIPHIEGAADTYLAAPQVDKDRIYVMDFPWAVWDV